MRVFVTGATGFVGSHVVEGLLDAGHEPFCLVRETSDTDHLDALGVEQFVGSLDDIDGLAPAVEASDTVIHLAGIVKARDPEDFYRLNGEATASLAELCAGLDEPLERFVYVSSLSAQGPCFSPGTEETTQESEPVSHYGRSKLLGEDGAQSHADSMPVTIFRPPPVYGPRDLEMFRLFQGASLGVAPIFGGGESKLSVVHIFDLVDAMLTSLEADHPSGTVFPIDDGEYYSWRDLVQTAGEAFGKDPMTIPVPPLFFEAGARASELWGNLTGQAMIFTRDKLAEMKQPHWVCGHRALTELLDWEPAWPLDRGAKQTAEWYIDHGWL